MGSRLDIKQAPISWATKFPKLVLTHNIIESKPNWSPSYSNWSTHICSPILHHRFHHRPLTGVLPPASLGRFAGSSSLLASTSDASYVSTESLCRRKPSILPRGFTSGSATTRFLRGIFPKSSCLGSGSWLKGVFFQVLIASDPTAGFSSNHNTRCILPLPSIPLSFSSL